MRKLAPNLLQYIISASGGSDISLISRKSTWYQRIPQCLNCALYLSVLDAHDTSPRSERDGLAFIFESLIFRHYRLLCLAGQVIGICEAGKGVHGLTFDTNSNSSLIWFVECRSDDANPAPSRSLAEQFPSLSYLRVSRSLLKYIGPIFGKYHLAQRPFYG